jgi:hypothetical protein
VTPFLWSQVVASGAFACGLISYQCRHRRAVLVWLSLLAILYAGHYFLLDRLTPAVLMLLTTGRYITAAFTQHRLVLWFFLAAAVATLAWTWSGPLSLLALAGASLGTLGSFQSSDRRMRQWFMATNCCWLSYNLLAHSPVATLMEVMFLTSNIIGYRRFYGRAAVK